MSNGTYTALIFNMAKSEMIGSIPFSCREST